MARQVGALAAAALWAVWLLLTLLQAPIQAGHAAGFAASFTTAYLLTRRVMTEGKAPPGVSLMLAGAVLVTAGMAAEFILIILPNKAALDVALPPPVSTLGYILVWGGVAVFALAAAATVLDVVYSPAHPDAGQAEEERRKLYFGEGRVKYRAEMRRHGKGHKDKT